MVFSLYSGLFGELRDKRNLKKIHFDLKASEPCQNIDISKVTKHRVMFVNVTFFVVKYSKHQSLVVQRLDKAIHWINRYPADKC